MKLNQFTLLNFSVHQNVLPWSLKKHATSLHAFLVFCLDCNCLKESLISHSSPTCFPLIFTAINEETPGSIFVPKF